MAGYNISMEQIDIDYSRVVDIDNETRTLKSKLYNEYELQKSICKDLSFANAGLKYAREECKKQKRLYKRGKISEDKYSEYGENLKRCKDSIRRLTDAKRKNSQAINSLRSVIKSNEKLLMARVDARYDWET